MLFQALDWSLLPRAALGVLALLAGNGYIVGINQVYDVSIDKVNKPFLPIAAGEVHSCSPCGICHSVSMESYQARYFSLICVCASKLFMQSSTWWPHMGECLPGELSPAVAWVLCIGLAAAGLGITAANFGREITMLYAFGLGLGTIYSVPPFRCLT